MYQVRQGTNIALRAVLPVWKTIPISILQKEAGTPPVHHTLDYLCKLAAIRLHRLEPRHPLRIKTRHASASPNPSRLERIAQECPAEVEYSDPLLDTEPWEKHLFRGPKKCLDATGGSGDKEKATAQFKTWLKTLSPLDMVIYTDGSQETDQTGTPTGAGAGWVINWVDSWHGRHGTPLGDTHEVYDAEAVALLEGLKEALKSPIARVAPGIHICLDNLSVAVMVDSRQPNTSVITTKPDQLIYRYDSGWRYDSGGEETQAGNNLITGWPSLIAARLH